MYEKDIIIDGHKIRYSEHYSDAGSVVYIFLHGWGSDHTIFKPLFGLVDNRVAFDFPGFGGSSPLREPWTLATYAAVLRAVLEKKTDGREVVFVAHSFGGRVLLQLLSQQSKLAYIRRVICIGIPFTREQKSGKKYIITALSTAKIATRLLPKPTRQNLRAWWCNSIGAKDYAALDSNTMKKTFQNIINTDMHTLAESLRDYNTDFVWGTDDTAAPIADAETVAQKIGATLHPIEGGDHFPFLGKTEKTFKTIFKNIIAL